MGAPDRTELTLRGPDDFVRLDTACAQLLRRFCDWLQTPQGGTHPPDRAGALAHAADRYLRNFVVEIKETGPADEDSSLVKQYLGNWYLINTLVPTHREIHQIAEALRLLYAHLAEERIVSDATARSVGRALAETDFFHRRLEDFWRLTPEGIPGWRAVDDYRRRAPLG